MSVVDPDIFTHTRTHTHTNTNTHTRTHTRIHTDTHAQRTRTHTHTYTTFTHLLFVGLGNKLDGPCGHVVSALLCDGGHVKRGVTGAWR